MNDMNGELFKSGFNRKQILTIKKYSLKDGVHYTKILADLRKRFIASCLMFLVLFALFISEFFSENGDVESYLVAMFVGALIIFFMAPIPLSWKSYIFFRKNPQLLS